MPRKQVNDLQQVNLGGAARQINTFVAAPRAAGDNGALALSRALTGVAEVVEVKRELDVKQATDRKLYGGSVFTDTRQERLADYETSKDSLRSMEDAEAFFLERTQQEFDDPHAASGYEEKRLKALAKFRGEHAEYLAGAAVAERSDHVFKDYISTVTTEGVAAAEARKGAIASNYGMSPKDLNQMTLNAAEVFIARGDYDQAKEVLNHKRGASGTLLENPDTAIEANGLMSKIDTEDTIRIANEIKSLEEASSVGSPFDDNQKQRLDSLLDNGHITVAKRNTILTENEEAVDIERASNSLGSVIKDPNRSFTDPIEGVSLEQSDKIKKKFVSKFYEGAERKRTAGSVSPQKYFDSVTNFSERTNTVSPEITEKLGLGFSMFSPQKIIDTGEVPNQLIQSVESYAALYARNPNVASLHTKGEGVEDFYDEVLLDMSLGTDPTIPREERIKNILLNRAQDTLSPIKGRATISVNDNDIMDTFNALTAKNQGTLNPFDNEKYIRLGSASNASQWLPYIKRQVQRAATRTGNTDVTQITEKVIEGIVGRSQRIGDYLVPMGTNTKFGTGDNIEEWNERAVAQYITANPEEGYDEDDLVLTPIVGQQDLWGVSVKGSNQILQLIPNNELPTRSLDPNEVVEAAEDGDTSSEIEQITKDEGVVKNDAGEHVTYLDTLGNPTAGHGHLLTPAEQKKYPPGTPIPQSVVDSWKETDIKEASQDVSAVFGDVKNTEAKKILKNMAFNLGRTKLNEFSRLKKAIKNEDYKMAAVSMRDSKWFKQTGNRSKRLVARMEKLANT